MLRLAAYLQFLLAIGHIIVMPWLDEAFRLYGINTIMERIAAHGAILPYIITLIIALGFTICGLYALSACGRIRKLPLLWSGIFAIAAVFIGRAMMGAYWMYSSHNFEFTSLSAALASGFIGLLYLIGGINQLRKPL